MKKPNKKIVIGLFIFFICLLSLTIYTSFSSNTDTQEVIIKSITPLYDETSTIDVSGDTVIFNDKNQVVDYKVVIENTQSYDIRVDEFFLSSPSEEFLEYTIKNIENDETIKANSTKEFILSLETTGIKGWGRNFSDELTANISFEKVTKNEEVKPPVKPPEKDEEKEEVQPPKEEIKQPEKPAQSIQDIINNSNKVEIESVNDGTIELKDEIKVPEGEKVETWIYPETEFYGYKEVDKSNVIKEITLEKERLDELEIKSGEHNIVLSTEDKEILGYVEVYLDDNNDLSLESPEDSKVENPYTSNANLLIIFFGVAGISIIGIVLLRNKKVSKYTILVIAITSTLSFVKAEEVIDLPITLNVSFESQNVMKPAYIVNDDGKIFQDFWIYREQLKNIYIENEIKAIDTYEYKFDVTESGNGRVIAYLVTNIEDSSYYDLYLQSDGIIYPNTNASYYFADMKNINPINNLEGLDTQNVTSMLRMFSYSGANNSNFKLDLSGFNTQNVINMSGMFARTASSTTNFVLDLSNFDTSNVIDMSGMFNATTADGASLAIDVSSFDTSNVVNMSYMFAMTGQNVSSLLLDISNFDTSNVTDMSYMFNNCGKYDSYFRLDLSNFNTSKVTDMSHMFVFYGFKSEELILDLRNFDTRNVTNMAGMFNALGKESKTVILDVSSFNTSKVKDMSLMFCNAGRYSDSITFDISNFDTSKVTDMREMFGGTGSSDPNFNLDLSKLDTSSLERSDCMFCFMGENSTVFNSSVTIENFNIISYFAMFRNALLQPGSQLKVNYTKDNETLVDNMIATKEVANSNVVKGNLIVDVDNLSIGDEIHISGEKFNVISQTDDTVTMLAQYNLDSSYRQSTTSNGVIFADTNGWENTPGPEEIDVQEWSINPKEYINAYIEYLKKELGNDTITGDLIALKDLKALGCTVPPNYDWGAGGWDCYDSPHGWIANNQLWWTRSSNSTDFNNVWAVSTDGYVYSSYYYGYNGVRPVITISKDTLKNLS